MKWRAELRVVKTKPSPSFERKKIINSNLGLYPALKIIESEGIEWPVILNKSFNFFRMSNFFRFLERIFEKLAVYAKKIISFHQKLFLQK